MIHGEKNVLTDNELVIIRDFLKPSRHIYFIVRHEHVRRFMVLNHT